ncbi:MAG: hypothetical protein BYD32DRAFT_460164 [Podila humilis]|nr:MAG: hypothetical protein BYD32DRAFT_460164 [Podila humilis]
MLKNHESVKRHYNTCSTVRRQVVEARTSQSTSEPSDDPRPTSKPESFIGDASPTASSVSGVVPYNDTVRAVADASGKREFKREDFG